MVSSKSGLHSDLAMKKRRRIIQFTLILLAGIWLFLQFAVPDLLGEDPCAFDERVATSELVYVEHAKCRMKCRNIDQKLVELVYTKGKVNCEKSSYKNGNPRYALEKRDPLGDKIRVIVEVDGDTHLIITVIRLGKRDHCSCS